VAGIDENRRVWTKSWDWSTRGEEWSAWWGGTDAMWFGALLPRIHAFIPAGTILEIAPGHGRWTQHLQAACDRLIGVDLSENCVEHCRQRFAASKHLEFHVNDGSSLDMIEDGSIDFVFSFDSLVHVEADVVASYLDQLGRKLRPDGVGFFHHSNLGSYSRAAQIAKRAPQRLLPTLVKRGVILDIYAWRSETMTAELFAEQCRRAGLACIGQEKISWESGHYLIDALSIFTPEGSSRERPLRVVRNPLFRQEANRMARLYALTSFPTAGAAPNR
jgi:SAM-dependent methyltransferase